MNRGRKIFVAGHRGLVGSALVRRLAEHGFDNLLVADRSELDLLDAVAVRDFFKRERPEVVFLAAGRTGGVYANDTYRAEFLHENLVIQTNVIHESFLHEVQKLIFLGCSCMYPKLCPQPMREEALLTGPLEPTNEPFAIAKLAGMKMVESYNRQYGTDFVTVIPTNLYGPNQDYTPLNCLLVPALISRLHEARDQGIDSVRLWGSGRPQRDFLYVDDMADACIAVMERYSDNVPINIGSGCDLTVREVAEQVADVLGYTGRIEFDPSMPEGVAVKLQDISRIAALGWKPQTSFREGIARSYSDFRRREGIE